jgi:acetyltransferase-like isoleucine patch superfamily enzyme
VRSTILTHQIDVFESRQIRKPVRIGTYCYIGSDVRIVPGGSISDRCAVGMGSVVVGDLDKCGMLYGGVPAQSLRELGDAQYFNRTERRVA